ncbi:hypothetical protein GGF32_004628 [Allomyces javanicus]|nr:hypothetical protein GGF32_004628 [Allomyces javanicus]
MGSHSRHASAAASRSRPTSPDRRMSPRVTHRNGASVRGRKRGGNGTPPSQLPSPTASPSPAPPPPPLYPRVIPDGAGTIEAWTALTLAEARARAYALVTIGETGVVDPYALFAVSEELVEIIEEPGDELKSARHLAIFLLIALHAHPSLPPPPAWESLADAPTNPAHSPTHGMHSTTPPSTDLSRSNTPYPSRPGTPVSGSDADLAHEHPAQYAESLLDGGLLSCWHAPIAASIRGPAARLAPRQRKALQVACNHPYLAYLIHLVDAGTVEESALTTQLLVSPLPGRYCLEDDALLSLDIAGLVHESVPLMDRDRCNWDAELDLLESHVVGFERELVARGWTSGLNLVSVPNIDLRRNREPVDDERPSRFADLIRALDAASTGPMEDNSLAVCLPSYIPTRLLSYSILQGLMQHNEEIAIQVIERAIVDEIADDLIKPTNPLRLSQLQVLHKLWSRGTLSKQYLPGFVSRTVQLASGSASARTVQLTAKFLGRYVYDLPPESLVEVQNFCSEYLRFKDVSDLFRLASPANMGKNAQGGTPPPATGAAGSAVPAASLPVAARGN